MRLVLQLAAVAAVAFIGGQGVAAVAGNPWLTLALGVGTAVLAVLVYGWVVRRTEHRPSVEVAREGAGAAIGRGTLIGVAMFVAVIANIAFLGHYEINGLGSATGAVGLFGFMAAAAVTEELLFRGVLFRIIEERAGDMDRSGADRHGVRPGALAQPERQPVGRRRHRDRGRMGMLAAAYIATRSLWLPIGVHFGWNFAAAGIFSTEVSGNNTPQGLLDTTTSGPALITGGDFGPEGSLYSVLFGVLATVAFMWLAHRRGHLVPRRRRAGRVDAATKLPQ